MKSNVAVLRFLNWKTANNADSGIKKRQTSCLAFFVELGRLSLVRLLILLSSNFSMDFFHVHSLDLLDQIVQLGSG